MPIIEADLIIAYINLADKHHTSAVKYFSKVMNGELSKPTLSPFALQELELGIKAQKILPHGKIAKNEVEVANFINEICEALDLYGISIQSVKCNLFAKSAEIRQKYNLSYYDSLHAASAFTYDGSIVSTDRKYGSVKGLERIDPRKL